MDLLSHYSLHQFMVQYHFLMRNGRNLLFELILQPCIRTEVCLSLNSTLLVQALVRHLDRRLYNPAFQLHLTISLLHVLVA